MHFWGLGMHYFTMTAVVLLTLGVAGCGTTHASEPGGSTSHAPAGASSGGNPATSLTVRYSADAGKPVTVWTLTCAPVGGNHPYAKDSCAVLDRAAAAGKDPFAPTRTGTMCTMIYGGPQTSNVTGTWRGRAVNASFSRKNGCEIARWNGIAPLVGEPPGQH